MSWVPWVCWAAILQALAYALVRDWLLAVDPDVWLVAIHLHSVQRGCESVAVCVKAAEIPS